MDKCCIMYRSDISAALRHMPSAWYHDARTMYVKSDSNMILIMDSAAS